jgi:putative endonuclease
VTGEAGSGGHYVYVLECADGTFYTGYTTDPERRVDEHDAGEGAKYTRGRTPVELRHVETFESKSAAMSREYEVKQLSRRAKARLIDTDAEDGDDAGPRSAPDSGDA